MSVYSCHICESNPEERQRLSDDGLAEGVVCPVCHRPTCAHHLVTVRWRWRDQGRGLDSARVCRECKRTYRHREWDPFLREWIS